MFHRALLVLVSQSFLIFSTHWKACLVLYFKLLQFNVLLLERVSTDQGSATAILKTSTPKVVVIISSVLV